MNGHRTRLVPIHLASRTRRSYRPRAESLEGRRVLAFVNYGNPIGDPGRYPFYINVFNPSGPTGVDVDYPLASTSTQAHLNGPITSATIDWGDGSPRADARVVSTPTDNFYPGLDISISGDHAFAESGTYHGIIHATGQDLRLNEVHEDVSITLSIAPAYILSAAGPSFLAAANIPYQADDLGRFFTNIPEPGTQVQGTIDWGDGSPPTPWDLQLGGGYEGGVQISAGIIRGTHTYASTGSYTVTTTIVGAGVTVRTEAQAEVIAQPLMLIDYPDYVKRFGATYPGDWETTLGVPAVLPISWVDFSRASTTRSPSTGETGARRPRRRITTRPAFTTTPRPPTTTRRPATTQ